MLQGVSYTVPFPLAIGCKVFDSNLLDMGTSLACCECCGDLSVEDTVCSFCLTKPPAGTVKRSYILSFNLGGYTCTLHYGGGWPTFEHLLKSYDVHVS